MTSSGNIRNQLVYVANHNKTFERHVQVSSFIWETPMLFSIRLYFYVQNLKTWQFMKEVSKYDDIPLF